MHGLFCNLSLWEKAGMASSLLQLLLEVSLSASPFGIRGLLKLSHLWLAFCYHLLLLGLLTYLFQFCKKMFTVLRHSVQCWDGVHQEWAFDQRKAKAEIGVVEDNALAPPEPLHENGAIWNGNSNFQCPPFPPDPPPQLHYCRCHWRCLGWCLECREDCAPLC